ncbi:hypothetical protein, partial [Xanthomonas translucens]|uniref:hypothetical protein n=2 Tax=Xanthomonas TaxID=338 RepID=UPI0013E8D850
QEFFLLFTNDGAIGKVKGNNSLERNEDVLKIIPKEFEQFKNEPAFCNEDASFFFWRRFEDHAWTAAPELPEYQFLGFLANGINAYKELMENYYEKFIDLGLINDIFEKLDVSESELKLINPSLEVEKIQEDIREIKGGK